MDCSCPLLGRPVVLLSAALSHTNPPISLQPPSLNARPQMGMGDMLKKMERIDNRRKFTTIFSLFSLKVVLKFPWTSVRIMQRLSSISPCGSGINTGMQITCSLILCCRTEIALWEGENSSFPVSQFPYLEILALSSCLAWSGWCSAGYLQWALQDYMAPVLCPQVRAADQVLWCCCYILLSFFFFLFIF